MPVAGSSGSVAGNTHLLLRFVTLASLLRAV